MTRPRILHSYCLGASGRFLAFTDKDRETNIAAVLKDGGRHILTHEFSSEATAQEMAQFREGVKYGYARAMSEVRSVLGIYVSE